ncbi:hypothetical protein L7F22_067118 [Adiantum nelumboides]|nr:hypothetical protein [Adiantum nelumboides]
MAMMGSQAHDELLRGAVKHANHPFSMPRPLLPVSRDGAQHAHLFPVLLGLQLLSSRMISTSQSSVLHIELLQGTPHLFVEMSLLLGSVQPGAGDVAAAAADENDDEDGDDVYSSGYVKLYLTFIISDDLFILLSTSPSCPLLGGARTSFSV